MIGTPRYYALMLSSEGPERNVTFDEYSAIVEAGDFTFALDAISKEAWRHCPKRKPIRTHVDGGRSEVLRKLIERKGPLDKNGLGFSETLIESARLAIEVGGKRGKRWTTIQTVRKDYGGLTSYLFKPAVGVRWYAFLPLKETGPMAAALTQNLIAPPNREVTTPVSPSESSLNFPTERAVAQAHKRGASGAKVTARGVQLQVGVAEFYEWAAAIVVRDVDADGCPLNEDTLKRFELTFMTADGPVTLIAGPPLGNIELAEGWLPHRLRLRPRDGYSGALSFSYFAEARPIPGKATLVAIPAMGKPITRATSLVSGEADANLRNRRTKRVG